MRMKNTLSTQKYKEVRGYFANFTRVLVPKALIIAVLSGIYLFYIHFGEISENTLSNFQIILLIKAILGLWLGMRGVLQVFFNLQPMVFTSHRFPFIITIFIILLSQIMFEV
jgi:hypothetical protein